MKQTMMVMFLTVSCLFATVPLVQAHEVQSQIDQINIVGIGEIEQEPDQALLRISIQAQQPTLLAAKQQADKQYQQVLAVIKKADIDKKQVKATRINAQPQYEWVNGKQRYKGEQVSRSLSIKILDLDKVSPLMQALVENGVSSIDGLTTSFQDETALQQQALAQAADNAKAKAQFLAQRLGRNLGSAFLISEQVVGRPQLHQPNIRMRASKNFNQPEAAPEEMFGTQKIKATINVSFNLL